MLKTLNKMGICGAFLAVTMSSLTAMTVGQAGGLDGLVIKGNETFGSKSIEEALETDPAIYLQNIPDMPAAKFYPMVAQRIKLGYLSAGFEEVSGSMTPQTDHIEITISEGSRNYNGTIQFKGLENLDPSQFQQIKEALVNGTAKQESFGLGSSQQITFTEGDPTNFTSEWLQEFSERTLTVLLEHGWFADAPRLQRIKSQGRVDLHVTFPSQPVRATVSGIQTPGLIDQRLVQLIKQQVGGEQGVVADLAWLEQVESKLSQTFQFSYVDVSIERNVSDGNLYLLVNAVPWKDSVPLEELSEERKRLYSIANALKQILGEQRSFSIEVTKQTATGKSSTCRIGMHDEILAFAAEDQVTTLDLHKMSQEGESGCHAYVTLLGHPVFTENEQFALSFGMGFGSSAKQPQRSSLLSVELSEVAIASSLIKLLDSAILDITSEKITLQTTKTQLSVLTESDRIQSLEVIHTEGAGEQRFVLTQNIDWIESAQKRADFSSDCLVDCLQTALPFKYEQKLAERLPEASDPAKLEQNLKRFAGTATRLLQRSFDQPKDVANQDRFHIPLAKSESSWLFIHGGLLLNQRFKHSLPADSPFGSMLEDAGNIMAQRPFAVIPTLLDRVEGGEIGPLTLALYQYLLNLYNQPYTELVAEMALKAFSRDALDRELSLITEHLRLVAEATDNSSEPGQGAVVESWQEFLKSDTFKATLDATQKYLLKEVSTRGAYSQSQYAALTARQYERASKMGYASADIRLGLMQQYGHGMQPDPERARELFEKYASPEHPLAAYCLAWLLGNPLPETVKPDHVEANAMYQIAAEAGNVDAQLQLGYNYEVGNGTAQDYHASREWYQKAAEQRNPVAQTNMGLLYANGKGVDVDMAVANEWYRKAAEQGNPMAQLKLGYNYAHGKGIEQSYTKANIWYLKSASQGNQYAQANLGYNYEYGNGTEQDYVVAKEWYLRAAEQGNPVAQLNLGLFYTYGRGVDENMTIANEWFQKAADQGNARAQYNLGWSYHHGDAVEQNLSKAFNLYQLAANSDNAWAKVHVGICHEYGIGTVQNFALALEAYGTAIDSDAGQRAALNIARMHESGFGMPVDLKHAYEEYQRLSEDGYKHAMADYARALAYGIGCEQNLSAAKEWIEKSTAEESEYGYAIFADFYREGLFATQNYKEALRLYRLAIDDDCAHGYYGLGLMHEQGLEHAIDIPKALSLYEQAAAIGHHEASQSLVRLCEKGGRASR